MTVGDTGAGGATPGEERELRELAARFGQEHVFRFWNELTPAERAALLGQVRRIDFRLLHELCRQHLGEEPGGAGGELAPAPIVRVPRSSGERAEEARARERGEELLAAGRVAAFVVAGGQGTRLGFDGPKGTYSIGPVTRRTLFQIFAEKIRATGRRHGRAIPWYIMTSEANHDATRDYFERHQRFGLDRDDVRFFRQEVIPAVDREGKFFLETRSRIFVSPNGHGGSLKALHDSGALGEMRQRGIDTIFYFQVDNPLVVLCDPVFLGYHAVAGADMSSKVVRKAGWDEKVGAIGLRNGKLTVIEYSDLPERDARATLPDGSLKYWAGSIAIHVLAVSFVDKLNRGGFQLPFHRAAKTVPHLDARGHRVEPRDRNGIKFEAFVFDALGHAGSAVTMEVRREDEFSPVKNAEGVDSPATSRQHLTALYLRWLRETPARIDIPRRSDGTHDGAVEISPLTALDARELAGKVSPDTFVRDGFTL